MRHRLITALAGLLVFSTAASAAVDFAKDVQPILETSCLKCHRAGNKKSDYKIDTKAGAFIDDIIKAGDADGSIFIELIELPTDDDDVMPPSKETPLTAAQKKTLRDWVTEGAKWPEGVTLSLPTQVDFKRDITPILAKLSPGEQDKLKAWIKDGADWPADGAELELTRRLHQKISTGSKEKDASAMANYATAVPASKTPFEMIAIKGGSFTMGSPDSEAKRKPHESPVRKVDIAPFWMGKCEVTWDEYEAFMLEGGRRKKNGELMFPNPDSTDIDLVSRPTKPYVEMTFGMGKERYPAISMTQNAALMYCKWLSAQTGHFYRLPTEAEWEYACRAGTTTAYSFGDDAKELGDYAWFMDNADFTYQKVGTKKPNPWGLHDMHGNVAEWTLDAYSKGGYNAEQTDNPLAKSRELYPRVARGGSWNDFPEGLRSASRLASTKNWKVQDPQLPKSIWYHTDAQWLGFRLVRPLEVPPVEEMHALWNTGIDHDTRE